MGERRPVSAIGLGGGQADSIRGRGNRRELGQGHRMLTAGQTKTTVAEQKRVRIDAERRGSERPGLLDDRQCGESGRIAGHHGRPACVRPATAGNGVCVDRLRRNQIRGDAQLLGHDLAQHAEQALADGRRA